MTHTILVVDDSPLWMKIATTILTSRGYHVIQASNGAEGLTKARNSSNVDLIVTDLRMPCMDGLAMIREVRRLPQYADVPIILLTSESGAELKEDAIRAGASWLSKPIRAFELLTAVSRELEDSNVRNTSTRTRSSLPRFQVMAMLCLVAVLVALSLLWPPAMATVRTTESPPNTVIKRDDAAFRLPNFAEEYHIVFQGEFSCDFNTCVIVVPTSTLPNGGAALEIGTGPGEEICESSHILCDAWSAPGTHVWLPRPPPRFRYSITTGIPDNSLAGSRVASP
jgi:two-component system, chemotaxis family, chemotaxis protein CheY